MSPALENANSDKGRSAISGADAPDAAGAPSLLKLMHQMQQERPVY
jgi:hypothetical protein